MTTREVKRDPELWRRQFVLDPMRRIQRVVHADLEDVLASVGYQQVRMPHINLLAHVPRDHGARMGALADAMQLTPGAVSQLVAHLERLGIVRRVSDPQDGRGVIVLPTPAADAGYEASRRRIAELEGEWERRVGTRRWRVFRQVLDELAAVGDGSGMVDSVVGPV